MNPEYATEPAHDFLRKTARPLTAIFAPRNVAVIGATEKPGSVGRTIMWNLISNPFGGTVFPVNPKRANVLGIKAYPSIADLPEKLDLAVVVTPAPTVPTIIGQCIDAGVKGAIIISAGFRELGPEGMKLEQQILERARDGKIRILGPNCLGAMNPTLGLNATFASTMARPGNVAFISQSGALCTAILDWSLREQVGFSAFVSLGSMLDVSWGDVIEYLGDDPHTKSILIYMESAGDAASFISAAREVALSKPIIVIKAGRTEEAAKAAVSHTGSLAGSDDVLNAVFRRCGILRVHKIADLFYMAEVLAKQPRPKGRHLTMLTNAGGPAVLATDALITDGGALAELAPDTVQALNELLPPHWSRGNPIDILGDAGPDRYAKALEIAARDSHSDGLLVILTPQDMTDPTLTAQELARIPQVRGKPILASWMGEAEVAAGVDILNRAGIPTFPYPDTAALAFNYMWRYSYNLAGLYETPAFLKAGERFGTPDRTRAEQIIETARSAGRTILTEAESKQLFAAYGIPTVQTELAETEDQAVKLAEKIGYPVVLKLYSATVTHKTDVGGVRLRLSNADAVRGAYRDIQVAVADRVGSEHFQGVSVQPMIRHSGYELILGSSLDQQFGPVILFGAGGELVEVFKDRALGLPPLNNTLALRLMEQTKIYQALKGVRGREPVDLESLGHLISRFSQLIVEQRWIKETDINPLLAGPKGLIALDARVVVHSKDVKREELPRLAIRPYPTQYIFADKLSDGTEVRIRPIRPEDEPLIIGLHKTLSEESVQFRYLHPMKLMQRISHERMIRVCFIDYNREMALVVDRENPETGEHEILGVGRLSIVRGKNEAEFALVVSDRWQQRGLGTTLLQHLLDVGRKEGLSRVTGYVHPDNSKMRRVCEKLKFTFRYLADEALLEAAIDLGATD